MKTFIFKNLILAAVLVVLSCLTVDAQRLQERPPKDDKFRPQQILRELGLSQEQFQQIRRINGEKQQLMQPAQMRLREANRNLDMAIYADKANDEDVQARLKEFQAAQAEVAQIRFNWELAVRKVLTPEQLARFRELRRQFMERMKERMDDDVPPQERDDMPNPPLNNRPFQQRPKNRIN